MHRRKGDSRTRAKLGLQGLLGKLVAEIWPEDQISQSVYDQGHDQLLTQAAKVFEVH